MSEGMLIELMYVTVEAAALLSAPIIITVLVVGLVSQIIQTVTQLKDQALSFVPKIFISGIVFVFTIPWCIKLLEQYVEFVFSLIEKARL